MFDEIICIGTSFTEGHGLHPRANKDILDWYKKNKNISLDINKHSYPSVLSELTGVPVKNYGWCGSSLDYVVRKADELFYEEDLSNKLLVLEYSNYGRNELYSTKYEQYIVANWGPEDGDDIKNGYATMLTIDYFKEYVNTTEIDWDFSEEINLYNKFLDSFQDEKLELIRKDRMFINFLHKLDYYNVKFLVLPLQKFFTEDIRNDDIVKKHTVDVTEDGMYGFISEHKLRLMDETNNEIEDGHPCPAGYFEIAKKVYNSIKNYE